ncbi:hypothetical protein EsH8_II_001536 [Colletotrichum jinshuiense]
MSRIGDRPAPADVSGSIYLITSDGQTLKLPMPSRSPRDPLNWSMPKRMVAMCVLILYSIVSMLETQAASLMYSSLAAEFNGKLLAALSFQGFAAGLSLSASILVVIDLTFIDERPNALGMFWSIGCGGALLCLPLVPALAEPGWRRFYTAWIGPCLGMLVCIFFFLPETYFVRPAVAFDGHILVQGGSEMVQMYEDWEKTPGGQTLAAAQDEPVAESTWEGIVRRWGVRKSGAGFREMWACYVQTMLCACNPLVFWVAILNALNFGAMLFIGETYAVVMMQPPYNLPERVISMVNPVAAIGSLLAWPVSTILTSRVARRLTLRNGGVRDAEHYLIAFLPAVLAGAGSVFLYGLTVQYKLSYIWIFVSYLINAFSAAAYGIASTLWVTEAFPRWAAPAMVIVGGAGYMLSFATSYAVSPWLKSQGYLGANFELGAILLVVGGVALPLAFWGKNLRQYIDGKWSKSEAGALRPQ